MKQAYLETFPVEIPSSEGSILVFATICVLLFDESLLDSLYLRYSFFEKPILVQELQNFDFESVVMNGSYFTGEIARYVLLLAEDDQGYETLGNLKVKKDVQGFGLGTAIMKLMLGTTLSVVRKVNPQAQQVKVVLVDDSQNGWTSRTAENMHFSPKQNTEKNAFVRILR